MWKTHCIGVSVFKRLHHLDLSENTLVVTVQNTSERGKDGDRDNFTILEQSSPALFSLLSQNGVKVTACSCSSTHGW